MTACAARPAPNPMVAPSKTFLSGACMASSRRLSAQQGRSAQAIELFLRARAAGSRAVEHVADVGPAANRIEPRVAIERVDRPESAVDDARQLARGAIHGAEARERARQVIECLGVL